DGVCGLRAGLADLSNGQRRPCVSRSPVFHATASASSGCLPVHVLGQLGTGSLGGVVHLDRDTLASSGSEPTRVRVWTGDLIRWRDLSISSPTIGNPFLGPV